MAICPHCNREVPDDAIVCPYCGSQLRPDLVVCGNCGSVIPADAKICPYCGAELTEKAICPNCGREIPADAQSCPHCGYRFDKDHPILQIEHVYNSPNTHIVSTGIKNNNYRKTGLIVGAIIVVALILISVFVFYPTTPNQPHKLSLTGYYVKNKQVVSNGYIYNYPVLILNFSEPLDPKDKITVYNSQKTKIYNGLINSNSHSSTYKITLPTPYNFIGAYNIVVSDNDGKTKLNTTITFENPTINIISAKTWTNSNIVYAINLTVAYKGQSPFYFTYIHWIIGLYGGIAPFLNAVLTGDGFTNISVEIIESIPTGTYYATFTFQLTNSSEVLYAATNINI